MSGFFGFGNFNKPGKGIEKNGPQKTRFFLFFELFFRKFWKLILTNFLFVASILPFIAITTIIAQLFPNSPRIFLIAISIPFLAMGPASAGLTKILRNFALEQPVFLWSDYFETIKKNWKQALSVSVINTIFGCLLFIAIYFYSAATEGIFRYIFVGLGLFFLLCYLFMQYYLYIMVVTFKFTLKQLYKNALILSLAALFLTNLITTFFLVIIWLGIAILFFSGSLGFSISMLIITTIAFSLSGFIIVFNSFPHIKRLIIDPYYEEQKRLKGQDNDKDLPEQIFTDRGRED